MLRWGKSKREQEWSAKVHKSESPRIFYVDVFDNHGKKVLRRKAITLGTENGDLEDAVNRIIGKKKREHEHARRTAANLAKRNMTFIYKGE